MKKLLRMALFATLPLAAMMMFSSYSDGADPQCPFDDSGFTVLLPNPENCSTFFSCSNGVPILMYCPAGLVFNDELDTCEFPSLENPCMYGGVGGGGGGLGGNEFKYRITKDNCLITLTAEIIANGKIKKTMERLGLGLPSVGIRVDLTSLTCLYSLGGSYRLGNDVRCADLF